jgi:hypothetical protein
MQTVVQQIIPDADMTPLERLLLPRIFESEPDGDSWYFFAEESPSTMIVVDLAKLDAALAASQGAISTAQAYVADRLDEVEPDEGEIDLDLSGISWEYFFQDIVKRSRTLDRLHYRGVCLHL